LTLCGALIAFAADDPWAKVKEIHGDTELQIYKKGSAQPLLVKMGEATEERLVKICCICDHKDVSVLSSAGSTTIQRPTALQIPMLAHVGSA